MKKIIISPCSRMLRNGKRNPKNYPYWQDLVQLLKEQGFFVIQVGQEGEEKLLGVDEYVFNRSLRELKQLLKEVNTWIAVDNFFHHLAYTVNASGIVIFGQSDPLIFGHSINENILKDRSYLRNAQFDIWEAAEYREDCFVAPSVVLGSVLRRTSNG